MKTNHFELKNVSLIKDKHNDVAIKNTKLFFSKLGKFVAMFFISFTLLFLVLFLIPQSPFYVEQLKANGASEQTINDAIAMFGLDKGFVSQYFNSLFSLFSFNFGNSWTNGESISNYLVPKMILTFEMGFSAISLGLIFGIPLGIVVAKIKSPKLNGGLLFLSTLIYAIPTFVFGYFWFYVAFKLGLPTMFVEGSIYWILVCAIIVALPLIFSFAKMVETDYVAESNSDHIIALEKRRVKAEYVNKNIIKSSLKPLVNFIPTATFTLLFSSLTLGPIFGIPGLGNAFVTSIKELDRPMILAIMSYYLIGVFTAYVIREAILIGVYKHDK